MKVLNKGHLLERTEIEVGRGVNLEMSNGTSFIIKEDIEGHLEITKEDAVDVDNLRLIVYPRYSNGITIK